MKLFISHHPRDLEIARKLKDYLMDSDLNACIECKDLLKAKKDKSAGKASFLDKDTFWALPSEENAKKGQISRDEYESAKKILEKFPNSDIFLIPIREVGLKSKETENKAWSLDVPKIKLPFLDRILWQVRPMQNRTLTKGIDRSEDTLSHATKASGGPFKSNASIDTPIAAEDSAFIYKKKIEHLNQLGIGRYFKNFEAFTIFPEFIQSSSIENSHPSKKDSKAPAHFGKNYTRKSPANRSFEDLFKNLIECYQECGFLYPDKKKRIFPHLDLISDNWKAAIDAGDRLFNIITYQEPETERVASIIFWRSTNMGWVAQHLIAKGNYPAGACAMMLQAQAEVIINKSKYNSFQNWFSPANRFASRVFGSLSLTIGKNNSDLNQFEFLAVSSNFLYSIGNTKVTISRYRNGQFEGLYEFVCKNRGKIFADAEEIGTNDIELDSLDALFSSVGLRRKRFIWVALGEKNEILGAVLVYRGPFGLNFSFIENRCDLIVDESLPDDICGDICQKLIREALEAYFGDLFPLQYPVEYIPVVSDRRCADVLDPERKIRIRTYNQSIWLGEIGFEGWYENVENISKGLIKRIERKMRKQ